MPSVNESLHGVCFNCDTKKQYEGYVDKTFITLHGLPTATTSDGISLVTTEPAPMVTLSPIVTPGRIVTLPPIQTLLPIETGSAHSSRVFLSTGSVL